MSEIVPYLFESREVRVVLDEKGEPWFVGADVCAALEVVNSRDALGRLNPDEKGVAIADTPGGSQQVTIISEAGVYRLVFTSRVEGAERFKRWLAHDVLPSIRKTGTYTAPTAPKTLPATYLEALKALVASEEEKERLMVENAAKAVVLAVQAPKVEAHTRFMDASGTMSLRDAIKVLGEAEKAFIAQLVEDKVFFRLQGSGRLRAYAHLEERGYFRHRAGSSEQTGKAYAQVRVTPAGLDWLSQRYPVPAPSTHPRGGAGVPRATRYPVRGAERGRLARRRRRCLGRAEPVERNPSRARTAEAQLCARQGANHAHISDSAPTRTGGTRRTPSECVPRRRGFADGILTTTTPNPPKDRSGHRGVLCRSCNLLLGHAKDQEQILEAAIAYLRRYAIGVRVTRYGRANAG